MKFVQYGAGNIGRGFIGQIFSKAGYEVVFIDVNMDVVNQLNTDHAYPVDVVSAAGAREELVTNVRAVDGRDLEAVAEEIATADIMATAVGVNILPRVVPCIAAGLKKRFDRGLGALDIIICENLLDADKVMKELLSKELSPEIVEEKVGLVEASIGRMVPVMTPEMQKGNILRVVVEEYDRLPVDQAAFKNKIPDVSNLLCFSPFEFFIRRKLFIHNMGHATCAYLGYLKGYSKLAEVMKDAWIVNIARQAMMESATALSKKYGVPMKELTEHVEDLLERFANPYLGDTVERVGKDTIRKLSRNDRLIGAALLCDEVGEGSVYIPVAIGAGLLFGPVGDQAALTVKAAADSDPMAALKEYSGLTGDEPFAERAVKYRELLLKQDYNGILELAKML